MNQRVYLVYIMLYSRQIRYAQKEHLVCIMLFVAGNNTHKQSSSLHNIIFWKPENKYSAQAMPERCCFAFSVLISFSNRLFAEEAVAEELLQTFLG